jgi:hypothetical protein
MDNLSLQSEHTAGYNSFNLLNKIGYKIDTNNSILGSFSNSTYLGIAAGTALNFIIGPSVTMGLIASGMGLKLISNFGLDSYFGPAAMIGDLLIAPITAITSKALITQPHLIGVAAAFLAIHNLTDHHKAKTEEIAINTDHRIDEHIHLIGDAS